MPLTTYLANSFEREHEADMFAHLAESLSKKTEKLSDPFILIGNLSVGGEDLDALLIKRNGLSVVELKAHGGLVSFDENMPWQVGRSEVAAPTRSCK